MSDHSVPALLLKKGCAKPLHGGHPWVFADAISKIESKPEAGDEVKIIDERGTCLGRGFFSPESAIAVRLLTRADIPVSHALIESRIDEALKLRREILGLGGAANSAYRLVNSEGDGLGGLIVDVYGEYISLQVGTAGIDRHINMILDILENRLKPKAIFDRSDARTRKIEKLPPPKLTPLRGVEPDAPFTVTEDGLQMLCDLRHGQGQKTGLFLDQRENRRRVAAYSAGRNVLDVFSYSGGFALHAAKAGAASIALIESSEDALNLAKGNLERNNITDADLINADWTDGFKHLREAGKQFDLIVLDPPKFARGRGDVQAALSGYRDLNTQAARLLVPGGLLVTCSCSGNVSDLDFERAVAYGLRATGRRAALLERRGASPDHPIPPGFEQGRYLKCLVLQVV